MTAPDPFVLGIALTSGGFQIMLAVVLWQAQRYRRDWGFGWLSVAYLLGGLTNLVAPHAPITGPASLADNYHLWAGAITGFGALACFVTGLSRYLGLAPWSQRKVFVGGLLLPPLFTALLSWALKSPLGGDLATAGFFVICAVLTIQVARKRPEPGHRLIAGMLLVQPVALMALQWLGSDHFVGRAVAAIPFSLMGLPLLSVSLHRHHLAVQRELLARMAAEDQLQHANDDLEQKVQDRTIQLTELVGALEAFNGMVSHDLRAPLRGLTALTDQADEAARSGDMETLRETLERQRALGQRMSALITDLLTLSRLQKTDMRHETTDLDALAQRQIDSLALLRGERVRQLITVHPLGCVIADPGLIEQVLANLLNNAVKFAMLGPAPAVVVSAHRASGYVTVTVQDNGPGFDPQQADKLFRPFSRLHPGVQGTGLGLTIVERIVRMHYGTVTAHGTPGQGAQFSFRLPE